MRFRPTDDPRNTHRGDPDPGGPVDWEDNAISNTFAWASYRITPGWCQEPDHWTSRLTQTLFTDCPCCLLFRGITVGMLVVLLPMIVALLMATALL